MYGNGYNNQQRKLVWVNMVRRVWIRRRTG